MPTDTDVILWNTLDSATAVRTSGVGAGFGATSGLTFVQGRFGDALATTGDARLTMAPGDFYGADDGRGTIECWVQKRMPRAEPFTTPIIGLFGWQPYAEDPAPIAAYWSDGFTGDGGLQFQIADAAGGLHSANDLGWDSVAVGAWVHVAFVWDVDGIDGSADRMRIYRDGALVAGNADAFTAIRPATDEVRVAGHHAYDRFGQPMLYMDNIKVREDARTDFSDRFVEGVVRGQWLAGTAAADTLAGDIAGDTVVGRDGDDSLSGDAGGDRMIGGDGADTLDGGAGDDTLDGGDGADVLAGGDGDDGILGNDEADAITGGLGDDLVYGGDGGDTVTGDDGGDELYGGNDDDSVAGGSGADIVGGGRGDDSLDGGVGNDRLGGNAGADRVSGGGGDDLLKGDGGDDTMAGGAGGDQFRFEGAEATDGVADADVIADYDAAEGDVLSLGAGVAIVSTSPGPSGAVVITLTGGDTVELAGVTDVDDVRVGRYGTRGDDSLAGTAGADALFGLAGDDTLDGADGDDRITGGGGRDVHTGGGGADVFVFAAGPTVPGDLVWERWDHPDGTSHWYAAVRVPGATWVEAGAAAAALGGHLATITSAEENAFVEGLGDVDGYAIGGLQPSGASEPGGGWQWVTGEPFSYKNWHPGQPDDSSGEDYLQLFTAGSWNDNQNDRDGSGFVGYVVESGSNPARDVITDFDPGTDVLDLRAFALTGADALADLLAPESGDTVLRLGGVAGRDVLLEGVNVLDLGVDDFLI